MVIGIDFDGTFAADPEIFRKVVEVFQAAGHKCVLVTPRRFEQGQRVRELVGDLMPIVFAGGFTKIDAAWNAGHFVDVWVDDNPMSVHTPLTYVGP